jgi:sec-independent protein translocase protein TatB
MLGNVLNLGGSEVLVILLIALLVLGPARLPGAGRQVGKALAEFRRVTSNVQDDLREAMDVEGVRETVNSVRDVLDVPRTLRNEVASAISSVGTTAVTSGFSPEAQAASAVGADSVNSRLPVSVPSPDGVFSDEAPAPFGGVSVPAPSGDVQ